VPLSIILYLYIIHKTSSKRCASER